MTTKYTNEQIDQAVGTIKDSQLMVNYLRSAAKCGMTTRDLARHFVGELSDKRMVTIEDRISDIGSQGLPLLFDAGRQRYKVQGGVGGRSGSKLVYFLSEFGRKVLLKLDPSLEVSDFRTRGSIAVNHRFCQMEVYRLALKMGLTADVEKSLPHEIGLSVRPDVTIHTPKGPVYIEIEQALEEKNVSRAIEKMQHWKEYQRAMQADPNLIFLFNLKPRKTKDGKDTLDIWRHAIWSEEPSFPVKHMMMYELETKDNLLKDLAGARELHPAELKVKPKEKESVSQEYPLDDMILFEMLEGRIETQNEAVQKIAEARKRRRSLYRDMEYASLLYLSEALEFIYSIDHTPPSDKSQYADPQKLMDIPENSLAVLEFYLRQWPDMYLAMREATAGAKKALGITQQRMWMNRVILILLKNFRIWPESPYFSFRVKVPDYADADFITRVQVLFRVADKSEEFDREVKDITANIPAVEWALTMIIAFPNELGLV